MTANFINGVTNIEFSKLSLTKKPECMLITACNVMATMAYNYDASSSNIQLHALVGGSGYNGSIKFSYLLKL